MPPNANQLVRGYIGFLRGRKSDDLTFQYNPTTVNREREASYAKNSAALADFPNSANSSTPALVWVRNEAEGFDVDLFFYESGNKDVEPYLKKLDDLMAPDPTTGQPRDLIFVMGKRSDRVRLLSKRVKEELFTPDQRVQQARVTLRMTALRSRSG